MGNVLKLLAEADQIRDMDSRALAKIIAADAWASGDHPRDEKGRFTSGGGSSGSSGGESGKEDKSSKKRESGGVEKKKPKPKAPKVKIPDNDISVKSYWNFGKNGEPREFYEVSSRSGGQSISTYADTYSPGDAVQMFKDHNKKKFDFQDAAESKGKKWKVEAVGPGERYLRGMKR